MVFPRTAAVCLGLLAMPGLVRDLRAEDKIPDNHIGAFFGMSPSYSGSNRFSKMAQPDVDVTIDKRIFINTDNGVGAYLINQDGWTFGPSVFVRLGRYQLSQSSLTGLHTIKSTPELRLSGGYDFGVWDITAAFSYDVAGDGAHLNTVILAQGLPRVVIYRSPDPVRPATG